MKSGKLLIIVSIGTISTLSAEIISRVLLYFGIGKYSIYELASLTVTFNRPEVFIGLIVDALIGSLVAVLLYFLIEKIGSSNLVIITIIGSLFAWLACEFLFTATIEGRYFDLRPISDYYTNIISSVVFGLTLGILFKRSLFKKSGSR